VNGLRTMPGFMAYALSQAIRHPRTPIRYFYCPECGFNLPGNAKRCPGCGLEVGHSPKPRHASPIPWWGSVLVMTLGVGCWTVGSWLQVSDLGEAGRALVYIPLGSLFGMSLPR